MKKSISVILSCLVALSVANLASAEVKNTDRIKTAPIITGPGPVISPRPRVNPEPVVRNEKNIELVFVVDTTGSMGGLIQGAKTKIWNIVNDVMQHQKKGTKVKIGLVAYRDRGDAYVTKVTGLSEDLDKVYATLMDFQAQGGGDEPEDVRQALWNGANSIQWSKTSSNLSKIIFLVGDARPHTDYKDFPTTVETAKQAKKDGVIINTIQCGSLRETDKYWREIAQYAGGEYFSIAQDGGTKTIVTPYDEQLRSLSTKLDSAYIPYGTTKERSRALAMAEETSGKIRDAAPAEAMAERAVNKSMNRYSYSSDDLVQGVENGNVKLQDLEEDQLPENMQKMTATEREAYVNKKISERKEIRAEIASVSRQREEYIRKNTPKESQSGFDAAVSKALAKQIR